MKSKNYQLITQKIKGLNGLKSRFLNIANLISRDHLGGFKNDINREW